VDTTELALAERDPDDLTASSPVAVERVEDLEAWQELSGRAEGRTAPIPARLLVRHVFDVVPTAEFPVRRACLEAILRRLASAERDELAVAERPGQGEPFGAYRTRRRRRRPRPYRTLLFSLDPLRASCDCRDFLLGSLGLCKHVLTVVADLAGRPARLERALAQGPARPGPRPRLVWVPLRPLAGPADWLAQVRLVWGADARANRAARTRSLAEAWLEPDPDRPGVHRPRATFPDDPDRRLDLVEALARHEQPRGRRPAGGRPSADPALAALLAAERDHLRELAAFGRAAPRLKDALRGLKRTLYPYQRDGVARFLATGRLLLADDMGLGKTVQATAACHALFRSGRVRRGLLIVPASLKAQWAREWALFTDAPLHVVDGPPEERRRLYEETRRGFLVANYAQARRDLALMQAWRPELVVLDEAQKIKNWATKTAHAVKTLQPPWRLVLTGTPLENRLDELVSITEWVDPHALAPKWRLGPWHTLREDEAGDDGRPRHGVHRLETLRERLAPRLLRRVRQEVLDQLPARTDAVLPVALTPTQAAEHAALDPDIAQLSAISERRPLTRAEFLRLMALLTTQRIVANGLAQLRFRDVWPAIQGRRPTPALLESLGAPKLAELRGVIEQLAVTEGRKVVVFSQWRRMLTLAHWAVSDVLAARGLRAVFFTGREPPKRRTRNVVDFHDEADVRVLFATDAGGVGLNLQRAATCCVNLELPWNPAVLEQRIARIHRLGQTRPIDVYHLVSEGSIESRIAGNLGAKAALFRGLFDGTADEVRFEKASALVAQLAQPARDGVEPPADADAPVAAPEDGPGGDEVEALLEAADESRDPAEAGPAPAGGPDPAGGPAPTAGAPSPTEVERLFASLAIQPQAGGGVRIDAPPEAARTLASLFTGMARLLGGVGEDPGAGAGR